jgi:hypothetical protein
MKTYIPKVIDPSDWEADGDPTRRLGWEATPKDTVLADWMVQYLRLVNYLTVPKEWGGNFREHGDYELVYQGKMNFKSWCKERVDRGLERKLYLNCDTDFSTLGSCYLSRHPSRLIPNPGEMYLSAGDQIVTLEVASRILRIPEPTLFRWKMELVLDHLVLKRYFEKKLGAQAPSPTAAGSAAFTEEQNHV